MKKAWIYVALTCLLELVWVFGFNFAASWWQWGLVAGVIMLDFHFFRKACEALPTGTVYAIFASAGTVGTALMDAFLFDGSLNMLKIVFIMLLILGVVGLKLADSADEKRNKGGSW
ncbi:DMT family transporter [Virgibacillus doumboii]|uniref:DMT family transporter n=1 Tax=Virgibacillus doumboii TaxID=2697503 RepID=UPI0013DFCAD0|nr:SMR family transporter [Virgibacillus doumboii]